MNRRPWPIVLLAVLQFLSPVIYLVIASFFYETSLLTTTKEILALTPEFRKFELFLLPIILGGLLLVTRRTGYYVVLLGCIYQISRAVLVFMASNQTDPVFPVIITNLFSAAVIGYLLQPRGRIVYFNPKVRWWETDPRYVLPLVASVTRVGAKPMKAALTNIAVGGVGVQTGDANFLKGEKVGVEFQHEGIVYQMKSHVVWSRIGEGPGRLLGLEWSVDNSNAERSKVRRLVRALRAKSTPTTRQIPAWWDDLKSWVTGSQE